jgi:excisionase family DNA binding protein
MSTRPQQSSTPPQQSPHAAAHHGSDPMEGAATRLLTAEQLADRWQVSKDHVYRLTREGHIPSVPIGRYRRYRLRAIEAWEADQEGVSGC